MALSIDEEYGLGKAYFLQISLFTTKGCLREGCVIIYYDMIATAIVIQVQSLWEDLNSDFPNQSVVR